MIDHECCIIFLFNAQMFCPDTLQRLSDTAYFLISRVFPKIMAEDPLPVCFKTVVDRMPVPVHYTHCAACKMAHRIQKELSRVRSPLFKCLSLRFENQIIRIFQRADTVPAKCRLPARGFVLRGMINIGSCKRQAR